ncbi:MAG: glutathione S-transferase [Alphaproteobacteria bacterium]|nr:glutathione S-transferase [Alphaproteobacteria bacterium]
MYTLYIGNKNYSSWSLRPWVLMRELGIAFEERLMPFNTGSSFDKFRAFSPTGCVPCLVDGALTVWDSLGITEYLAERHESVWPRDEQARAWARCASAEMHSGFAALREYCSMNCGIRVKLHATPPALVANIARLNELWLEGLSRFGGPFLAGSAFTAVDAFFAPVAFRHLTYGFTLDDKAAAYAQRLRDLPSMRAWYEAALNETWREPDHEDGARAYGTWVEDLRAR